MGRHVAGYGVLLVIGALLAQAVHAGDWPKDASGRPASGEAIVQVTVDADGHASHARIVRTTGNADLDRKALSVVEAHAFSRRRSLLLLDLQSQVRIRMDDVITPTLPADSFVTLVIPPA